MSDASHAASPELLAPVEDALLQRFDRRDKTTSARVSDEELARIAAVVLRPCLHVIAVRAPQVQRPQRGTEPTS